MSVEAERRVQLTAAFAGADYPLPNQTNLTGAEDLLEDAIDGMHAEGILRG